jgi:hypothetical protein
MQKVCLLACAGQSHHMSYISINELQKHLAAHPLHGKLIPIVIGFGDEGVPDSAAKRGGQPLPPSSR